jgi:hypothetical protein
MCLGRSPIASRIPEDGCRIVVADGPEGEVWVELDPVRHGDLFGTVLPKGSAVAQTLAGRRKRFRQALRGRLAAEGWREVGVYVYVRSPRTNDPTLLEDGVEEGTNACTNKVQALLRG